MEKKTPDSKEIEIKKICPKTRKELLRAKLIKKKVAAQLNTKI